MPKRRGTPDRFQLGPFWLWYRTDRDDWTICWLEGRRTGRKSTGIGGSRDTDPPEAAQKALADHYLSHKAEQDRITAPAAVRPDDMLLWELTTKWLTEHVAELEAPERYAASVQRLDAFWEHMRARSLLPDPLTVQSVTGGMVDEFVRWRAANGASQPTISRDLAALRGPISWGLANNLITSAPRIKDVKNKKGRKELEWDPEQVAVLLEAAAATPERQHVHLFIMIMLSTHARAEATLELHAEQIKRGLIFFLRPGEDQTRKRRSIVPVCPTLAPWLAGIKGKVIRYRAPISEKKRVEGGPTHFERPTANIGNAFEGVLLEAHRRRPDLGFARVVLDELGKPVMLPARKHIGETEPREKLTGIGTPNTLRHTIHTWHKVQGVPDAQIDAAAGHSEKGTGANYTHLRPDYLREFMTSTEAFWSAVGRYTSAHLQNQRDTKTVSL